MVWRKVSGGDRWHQYYVYKGRKNGVRLTVAPASNKHWYVLADLPDGTAQNSLWPDNGTRRFDTADDAMKWAETWLQPERTPRRKA